MICVDCRRGWGTPSGLPGYQRALAQNLPGIAPKRHFRLLLSAGQGDEGPGCHSNAHAVYADRAPVNPVALWPSDGDLDVRGLSLLHATSGLSPDVQVPVVSTIHDALWISEPERVCPPGVLGCMLAKLHKRLMLRAVRRSIRVIVPSQTARQALAEVAPESADRIRVIPMGVSRDFFPIEGESPGAHLAVSETARRLVPGASRYVLDVGQALDHRHQDGLVRAFCSAFRRDPGIHLVLVQRFSSRTRALMKLAARLDLSDRIHVLSGLSNVDLCRLYQGAVCLCHPVSYESSPSAIAEAMASGCPVITSGRAAAGEIADGAALLINPEREDEIEAALRKVDREPGAAARLRALGLARSRKLDVVESVRATWRVYEEALAASA